MLLHDPGTNRFADVLCSEEEIMGQVVERSASAAVEGDIHSC
jgi:hypothetical protein